MYLVAMIDLHSRYIVDWKLSNTLETDSCVEMLNRALQRTGFKPEIVNSDQGSQFTGDKFTGRLLSENIRISMDGKGRALDNVIVERFWRSLKYEEVYIKDYKNMKECREGIDRYIKKYNSFRPHSSVDGITPDMAYRAA